MLDGGDGGFDTLILDGGTYDTVTYTPTGPDSGTIDLDGEVFTYAGLEPVVDNTITVNRIITTSAANDNILITQDGVNGAMTVAPVAGTSTFEGVTFTLPSASLIIQGGLGTDTISFGTDIATGGTNLVIEAENIVVDGVAINTGAGDLKLTAEDIGVGIVGAVSEAIAGELSLDATTYDYLAGVTDFVRDFSRFAAPFDFSPSPRISGFPARP